jgi:hypothetical protein
MRMSDDDFEIIESPSSPPGSYHPKWLICLSDEELKREIDRYKGFPGFCCPGGTQDGVRVAQLKHEYERRERIVLAYTCKNCDKKTDKEWSFCCKKCESDYGSSEALSLLHYEFGNEKHIEKLNKKDLQEYGEEIEDLFSVCVSYGYVPYGYIKKG